jgi:hypothetical protein
MTTIHDLFAAIESEIRGRDDCEIIMALWVGMARPDRAALAVGIYRDEMTIPGLVGILSAVARFYAAEGVNRVV